MVARLARLVRRGPRPRPADDDDWGTASPEPPLPFPMDLEPSNGPDRDMGVAEAHHDVVPKEKGSVIERLKAQELSSYTCTFSPRAVITIYFVIGIVFVPLGASIVAGTGKIRSEGPFRYDDVSNCDVGKVFNETKNCKITITVNERIPAPSYLYYTMTNYHQNARKYAKSRSDTMNAGELPKVMFDVENCEPWLYRDEEREDVFDPADFHYPCGLTARSRFNDSFILCKGNDCESDKSNRVNVSEDRISWWTDREHKFGKGEDPLFNMPDEDLDGKTANNLLTDEHFIVWMRLAAFPNFMKLYAIIQEPLEAGENYTVAITSQYPVKGFAGTKSILISTTQWFGNANTFLGTSYLVVGFVSLFIATVLLAKHLLHPRPPADSDPSIILRELAKLNADYRKARPES